MEQYILKYSAEIYELEQAGKWKTVADLVFHQWRTGPMNFNQLLCAGVELWYALLVYDYCRNSPPPIDDIELPENDFQLQCNLMEVTRWGFQHFSYNAAFNAYFGYMMKVMPYYFIDYNGDYDGWQQKGISMMRYSYSLDPVSPFTKAMFYEPDYYNRDTPFYDACKELWSTITPEEWGKCEAQQYFFRILFGDSFYPNAYDEA